MTALKFIALGYAFGIFLLLTALECILLHYRSAQKTFAFIVFWPLTVPLWLLCGLWHLVDDHEP